MRGREVSIQAIHVEIYSRPGCHLCDDAKAEIERTIRRLGAADGTVVTVTDIDQNTDLKERYGSEVPVIFINGTEEFRYRVDTAELERKVKQLWNRSTS